MLIIYVYKYTNTQKNIILVLRKAMTQFLFSSFNTLLTGHELIHVKLPVNNVLSNDYF